MTHDKPFSKRSTERYKNYQPYHKVDKTLYDVALSVTSKEKLLSDTIALYKEENGKIESAKKKIIYTAENEFSISNENLRLRAKNGVWGSIFTRLWVNDNSKTNIPQPLFHKKGKPPFKNRTPIPLILIKNLLFIHLLLKRTLYRFSNSNAYFMPAHGSRQIWVSDN